MAVNMSTPADAWPITYYLNDFWSDVQDPRTRHYLLVDIKPSTFVLLMSSYVIFSTKIGPRLMANRQPFNLRTPMLIYNILMIIVNFYFFVQVVLHLDWGRRLLETKFPDRTDTSPVTLYMLWLGYTYWWSKFADLLDTLFFILRKKQSHITFLHVYHHASVPVFGWMMLKINIICPAMLVICLNNSLVHTLMYSYYALSAMGPEIQKYLWWKKYLTQLQLIQFVVSGSYVCIFAVVQTGYPPALFVAIFIQPFIFFIMFFNFYKKKYKTKTS